MSRGPISNPVVLIEATPGRFNEIARRIRLQGAEPVIACGTVEAASMLPDDDLGIAAVLIDVALASRSLKKELGRLRTAARGLELYYLAVGEAPSPAARKKLRHAGVRSSLWEPFDDAALRFQLNRAWNADRDDHKRRNPRIPTYLHAQIGGGQRVKDGVVYSLSIQGAFIETPRASMAGAIVDVAIRLPNCFVETKARVVFANVPGNLQRPNLPLGMAVRFEELDVQSSRKLKAYVKERLAELEV
jgi:PilZ domain